MKIGNKAIMRYSNALIRRGIEDITSKSAQVVIPITKKPKILLLAEPEEALAPLLSEVLSGEGFAVTVIAPYNRLELVYNELGQTHYDMVIPTNNALTGDRIPSLVQEIKKRFPQIRIIVASGFMSVSFLTQLKTSGIDTILSMPFQTNVLLQSIRNELSTTTDNRTIILLSHYLVDSFKRFFESLGCKVLWAEANLEELEQIAISNNIDLAIEWQHGEQDYPLRDMLKRIGKVVPIYLSLNWNGKPLTNVQELGYVDFIQTPWTIEELRQTFIKMLTPQKQLIFKKTAFWTYKKK